MDIVVKTGKYVVAVSGGVDSTVLLHLLNSMSGLSLIVVHYDHGIRDSSAADKEFVARLASSLNLPFEYDAGNLGPNTSEDTARNKRYEFLESVRIRRGADAIITAHHQDDLLETMCINLLRGTNRRGLSSLGNTEYIIRPLLNSTKEQIKAYAQKNGIDWVEDESNYNQVYLRNYIRHIIIPRLDDEQKSRLLAINKSIVNTNQQIESEINNILSDYDGYINRQWFAGLSHAVASEVAAGMLRKNNEEVNSQRILRTVTAIKTLLPGKKVVISNSLQLHSKKDTVTIAKNQN